MTHEIDDGYGTCKSTFATLRIFSGSMGPPEISAILGVEPTRTFRKGGLRTEHPLAKNPNHQTNGWFYSTEGKSTSRDCRRHLDMLIEAVLGNPEAFAQLRRRGCEMDLTIFYSYRQGGPTISPDQMRALGDAGA
jgi:hypothetical protein